MNLLIIGNGFDLAHDLPTQYKDFLKFVNLANAILDNDLDTIKNIETSDGNDDNEIKKTKDFITFIKSLKDKENFKYIEELHKLSIDNLWFNYFNNLKSKFNTWIDFETEISKVIQILETVKAAKDDAILYNKSSFKVHDGIQVVANLLQNTDNYDNKKSNQNNNDINYHLNVKGYSLLISKLLKDLNRLTRCLEIYLSFYINSLDTNIRIPEIIDLSNNNIDYVLSFNYTNTFERFYKTLKNNKFDKKIEFDYIHGKASLENDIHTCPLVLGIDEYLDDNEKNINIDFIQYKKYFQRISKKTGCKYISLLENLKELNDFANKKKQEKNNTRIESPTKKEIIPLNIYIFGHSLDITDKDVLYKLIMHGNTKTTIYYHNNDSYKKQIANLVRVLSQDVLIDSVYGMNPRIKFVKQKEVKESEEKNIVESEIKEVSTIAAHNDYLDEPGEKENIQSDLDEMDSWDNEE